MKILLAILFAFLLALIIGHYIVLDPGYWLMAYGHWSIEMPLWLGILGVVLSAIAISFIFSLLHKTANLPNKFRLWTKGRKRKYALQKLQEGILKLGEGKWQTAEDDCMLGIKVSEIPMLHYLAAADAAHHKGNDAKRDDYFQLAYSCMPKSKIALGLIQARYQIEHEQYEQALANLKHLSEIQPKHQQVLLMLKELYLKLEDWQALLSLLPELKRQKVLEPEYLEKLELQINLESLKKAALNDNQTLQLFWKSLSKKYRKNADVIYVYVKACVLSKYEENFADLIQTGLKQINPPEELFHLYINLKEIPRTEKIRFLSELSKQYPQDANIWFASGCICLEEGLLGQAKHHFEQALQINRNIKHLSALAYLYEVQGQEKIALSYYHQACFIASPIALMQKDYHERPFS